MAPAKIRPFRQLQTFIKRFIMRFPLTFLLLLALLPRLYNLTAPVIGVHSWRQADTAAIARNFYEMPFTGIGQYFYPQVDWGGGGFAETEFPLYPWLVSGLYEIFGSNELLARGLSVVCSLIGLFFLYRLVTLWLNPSVAFWSALFYAILPLSIFYGRTVQPESMVLMSGLGGLYFFIRWLDCERWGDLLVSGIFVAIAALLKVLPLVYLGLPLIFLANLKYRYGGIFLQWRLWLYALGILGITAAWYFHAHSIFLDTGLTFGFWSGDTDRYSWGSLLTPNYWLHILFRLLVRHFAVVGFVIVLIGLRERRHKPKDWLWDVCLGGSFLAGALAPTSSYVHEYYQLPIMVFGVVFMGKVYARFWHQGWQKKALTVALTLTLLTSAVLYTIDYMWPENPNQSPVYALAQQIDKQTPPGSKILAITGGDPTLLYLAHRHGWMISPDEVTPERLATAKGDGASFFVGSYEIVQSYADFTDDSQKENIRALLKSYKPVVNDERIFIAPL
jgi:4-amino-4-deoxy-L-arabinose transferase-like glycosyltransferase